MDSLFKQSLFILFAREIIFTYLSKVDLIWTICVVI